jgi:hypothetical protein
MTVMATHERLRLIGSRDPPYEAACEGPSRPGSEGRNASKFAGHQIEVAQYLAQVERFLDIQHNRVRHRQASPT